MFALFLLHAAGACDFYFVSCLAMAVSLVMKGESKMAVLAG